MFDFKNEYVQGESNSLPDFLTREFLQGSQSKEEATSQVAVVVIKEEVIPLNQGKKSIFKGK